MVEENAANKVTQEKKEKKQPNLTEQHKLCRSSRPKANSAFRLFGVDKCVVSRNRMCWRHLVKAREVTAGLIESNGSLLPVGWLSFKDCMPVCRDKLQAQRSVPSIGDLYLTLTRPGGGGGV